MIKLKFVSLLLTTIILFSCTKENKDVLIEQPKAFEPNIEMKKFLIENIGFFTSNIEENENEFIVEGDVLFSKRDFWERYEKPKAGIDDRHYRSQYKTNVPIIEITFSTNIPGVWKTAFRNAITYWNALRSGVRFTEFNGYGPPSGNGIKIYFVATNATPGAIAVAGFPSSNLKPYHTININSLYNGVGLLTPSQKNNAAAHEMGHCIGFMHTDISSGATQIITSNAICNASADIHSVFQRFNHPFYGFSPCDQAAIKVMYP